VGLDAHFNLRPICAYPTVDEANLSVVVNKLKEFYGKLQNRNGLLLPAWRQVYGETRTVTFNDIITAYTRDPSCKAFVDFLADQAVGAGFYTTVNEEYPQAKEAKQVIDSFNESVNLDELMQIAAREIVASGNSFWLKTEPQNLQDLKILPLTGFDNPTAIKRNQYGTVTGYNYSYGDVKTGFKPEQIIHFCWNPVNFLAYGTGVFQVLLTELCFNGETRISFLEMKARIEKVMPEIFEKYAGPDELWIFAGASDEKLAEYQKLIQTKSRSTVRLQQTRSRHQNRFSRPQSPLRSLHRPHPQPSLLGRTNPPAKTVYHARIH